MGKNETQQMTMGRVVLPEVHPNLLSPELQAHARKLQSLHSVEDWILGCESADDLSDLVSMIYRRGKLLAERQGMPFEVDADAFCEALTAIDEERYQRGGA